MKFCKALFARALPIVLLHRIFEILPHAGSVVWYVGSQRSDRKSESATLAGGLRCICYGLVLWNCVRLCHRLCVWSRTGQRVRLMNYRFPLTLSPAIGCECTTPWRQQIASCTYTARASGKKTPVLGAWKNSRSIVKKSVLHVTTGTRLFFWEIYQLWR